MGVIKDGPYNLAKFLYEDKRVSHFVKGEIFGGEEEFNLQVLTSYLDF